MVFLARWPGLTCGPEKHVARTFFNQYGFQPFLKVCYVLLVEIQILQNTNQSFLLRDYYISVSKKFVSFLTEQSLVT